MELKIKQIGQNILLTVDGESYSKRFEDETLRNEIKNLAKEILAKPNKTKLAKLIKYFTVVQEKVKREEVQAAVIEKSVKKKIAKEVKVGAKKGKAIAGVVESVKEVIKKEPSLKEKLAALEKENAELKAKYESKPAPAVASTPRTSKEW